MLLLRILLVLLALAASLQAGDPGLADSSSLTAAPDAQETTLANKSDSTPEKDAVNRPPNNPDAARPTSTQAPSTATDTGASGAMDFPQEPSSSNPWLYIIIGFLLITGVLLYVDPRIF